MQFLLLYNCKVTTHALGGLSSYLWVKVEYGNLLNLENREDFSN